MFDAEQPLSSEAICRGLGSLVIGRRVLYYPRLTSTMDAARDEARKGGDEGTVIITDEQTAGRGRLKRSWLAPSGNIALSVLLYPRLSELPSLIMLASLGVARSVEAVTGIGPEIKWPNDVLIKGRKVCGILIELDARPSVSDKATYAIIGIGINVNLDPAAFSEIESTATSLSIESGRPVSRLEVVRSLLVEMDRLYLRLKDEMVGSPLTSLRAKGEMGGRSTHPTGDSLFEEWSKRLVTLGQKVRVTSVDAVFVGIAESVERDGSLLVRVGTGELRRVVAGDVTLRNT